MFCSLVWNSYETAIDAHLCTEEAMYIRIGRQEEGHLVSYSELIMDRLRFNDETVCIILDPCPLAFCITLKIAVTNALSQKRSQV